MPIKTYEEIYKEALASDLIDAATIDNLNPDQILNPQFFPWDLPDGKVDHAISLEDNAISQFLQLTLKDDATVIHAQRTDAFPNNSFLPFLEATKGLTDAARAKKLVSIYRRGRPYQAGHYYAIIAEGEQGSITNPLMNTTGGAEEVESEYFKEAKDLTRGPWAIASTNNDDPYRFKQIGNNGCNFSAAINVLIQVHKDNLGTKKLHKILKFLFQTEVSDNPQIVALSSFVRDHEIIDEASLRQFLQLANAVYEIKDDDRNTNKNYY